MSQSLRPKSATAVKSSSNTGHGNQATHQNSSAPMPLRSNYPLSFSAPASTQHPLSQRLVDEPTRTPQLPRGDSVSHSDRDPLVTQDQSQRKSAAVSSVPSNISISSVEGTQPPEREIGFRATIRRMLGSQKHKPGQSRSKIQTHPHPNTDRGQRRVQKHITQPQQIKHRAVASTGALTAEAGQTLSDIHNSQSVDRALSGYSPYLRRNTLPNLASQTEGIQSYEVQPIPYTPTLSMKQSPDLRSNERRITNRRSRSADAMMTILDEARPTDLYHVQRNSPRVVPQETASPKIAMKMPHSIGEAKVQRATHQKQKSDTVQPPQAFDFGLSEKDLIKPASVEQRINTLEVKLMDFEYALARLQQRTSSKSNQVSEESDENDNLETGAGGSSPSSMTTSSTKDTSCPGSPIRSTPYRVPTPHPRSPSQRHVAKVEKYDDSAPEAESTIPSSLLLVLNQTEQLLQLLEEERTARQQMEMHIVELQKEVQLLRAPVYASIRPYKLPQPTSTSQDAMDWKRANRSLHRTAPFNSIRPTQNINETSRFSMTESELETEDGVTEIFETPQERYIPFEEQRGRPAVALL